MSGLALSWGKREIRPVGLIGPTKRTQRKIGRREFRSGRRLSSSLFFGVSSEFVVPIMVSTPREIL